MIVVPFQTFTAMKCGLPLLLLLPLLTTQCASHRSSEGVPVVHAVRIGKTGFGANDLCHFVSVTNGVVDAGTTAPDGDADLCYRFGCVYDDTALHVTVLVQDDERCTDTCPTGSVSCAAWDDDAVEIFIDGEFARLPDSRADGGIHLRHGGEFAMVANGAANSDYSGYPRTFLPLNPLGESEKFLLAKTERETSGNAWWSGFAKPWNANPTEKSPSPSATLYRFTIPWSAMGRTNRPDRIGFNIGVQDDDGGGGRDHALYWTGNPQHPFSDESAFGILVFDDL